MLYLFTETKVMGSVRKRQKHGLYSQTLHFYFYILTVIKFSSIVYYVFIPFFIYTGITMCSVSANITDSWRWRCCCYPINGGNVPVFDAS
jgi:hypothetical protein